MSNKSFSPYKAAQLISAELGRTVRPQQVYGLIRSNPNLQVRNELGHLVVDEKFIANYVESRRQADAKKAEKTAQPAA